MSAGRVLAQPRWRAPRRRRSARARGRGRRGRASSCSATRSAGRSTTRRRTSRASRSARATASGRRRGRGSTRDQVVFHTSHFAGARPALDRVVPPARDRRTSTVGPGRRGTPSSTVRSRASVATPTRFARDPGHPPRAARSSSSRPESTASACTGSRSGSSSTGSRSATTTRRDAARDELGLPRDAFVVGSFQKDGVGMGDGLEPKTIKGPDVLVAALDVRARGSSASSSCSSPGRRAATSARSSTRRGVPHVHRLLPTPGRPDDGLPRARRLPRRLAAGGWPEEHPRVDGDRRSARHDEGRAGARISSTTA